MADNHERKMLESLLAGKHHLIQAEILRIYDGAPDMSESGKSVDELLSFDPRITSKATLHSTLERLGLKFGTPEYNDTYDRFCKSHPMPLV